MKNKHLLSFLLLMAMMGQMQAQDDVYRAGYYYDDTQYQKKCAAIFKNDDLLYYYSSPLSYVSSRVTSIAVDPDNGDVYWALLYTTNEFAGNVWFDIFKNSTLYLSLPTMGTMVDQLCISEGHLYAVGSVWTSSSADHRKTVCWKDNNTTPYLDLNDTYMGFNYNMPNHICVNNGNVYIATNGGKVTKNGAVLYDIGSDYAMRCLAYYDGHLYYGGDNWSCLTKIWKDGQVLYQVSQTQNHVFYDFCLEGGDTYILYNNASSQVTISSKVYKNGQLLYEQWFPRECMDVVSSGVYVAGTRGLIKNNEMIIDNYLMCPAASGEGILTATTMQVVPHCDNEDIHPLPFTEDFETIETGWECWTKFDLDNNNAGYPSYWDRTGNGVKGSNAPSPYSGNNCAKHRYLSSSLQSGLLVTPRLFLQPNRTSTTLSFWTYEQYPDDYQYEGVWISTTGNDPSDFTEQVWTLNSASASWKHVTVDLTAYQGEAVYLAFRYVGQNGHNWYIDDVEVTEDDGQCYTEGYLPYTQTFDYEMGTCWYVIDADMSGGKKCWKWSSDNQCVYHPYGQSGVPQEGWLISRPISLWQEDYGYTLSFKSKSTSSGTGRRNSVWISVDQSSSNPPDLADFTEIWVDPSYSSSWTEYEIDLSEYAGHNVNIAFKYEGTWAHNWYIDDFSVSKFYVYTITATADPTAGGSVSGAGTFVPGSSCTLTATANSGYTFVNWTRNGTVVSINASYTFTVNNSGDYVAHFNQTGGGITQTTDFTNGWNWWSGYVELDGNSLPSLENGLGTHGVMVKSQNNGYASYLSGYGWYGSLTAINNECTYQVKTDATCTVSLSGNAANPASHPVTLTSGWTWVGYPVNASMSVSTALAGITPQSGDMLKSQNNGYASYLSGYGWYGSLNTLQPGMGLMYKSNRSSSITLTYPNGGSKEDLKANQTAEGNHWQPNLNAYADNMSVMAVVKLDDVELQGENYELAAFANGEVRGSAKLMFVEPLNRYMAFLTVAGDEASELRFGLYDAETSEECFDRDNTLVYKTNAVVGSFVEPYVVSFHGTTGIDEWASSLQVYPNPVGCGQTVSLGLGNDEADKVNVEIINALGVVETVCTSSLRTIVAPKVAGVYILRITTDKGTCYRRLIVR